MTVSDSSRELQDLEICRLISRLTSSYLAIRSQYLKEMDLTLEQAHALEYLYDHPDCSIRALANHLQVTHQVACGIINRLQIKKLVYTTICPTDARAKALKLTDRGDSLARWILNNGIHTGHLLTQEMNNQEIEEFSSLVSKAIQHLEGKEEQ